VVDTISWSCGRVFGVERRTRYAVTRGKEVDVRWGDGAT
jgi:hypothetical protein